MSSTIIITLSLSKGDGPMRHAFLILAFTFVSLDAYSDTLSVLGPHGLGRLQIGVTNRAAEKALGMKLELYVDPPDDTEACQQGGIAGKPGISFLTEHHRIARIVVSKEASSIATPEGVHIGTTESQLREIFGKRAAFESRPYEGDVPGAHEVVVKLDAHTSFVFQTENYKVDEMRVGTSRAVRYWEGCA